MAYRDRLEPIGLPAGISRPSDANGREIERLDGRRVVVEHVKALVRGVDLDVARAGVGERGYEVAGVHARGGIEALHALRRVRVGDVEDTLVDGHALGAGEVARRQHVDERAARAVVALHLVGHAVRDQQVAVETDREAERVAERAAGRRHLDEGAGRPVVLPNGVIDLAGDQQAPGHFSFLVVSAGLRRTALASAGRASRDISRLRTGAASAPPGRRLWVGRPVAPLAELFEQIYSSRLRCRARRSGIHTSLWCPHGPGT